MIALLALAAQAAAPQPADLRTFRDWTVGCDNGRACKAVALVPEGGDRENYLLLAIERDGVPGAQARLYYENPQRGDRLFVDGKLIALGGGATLFVDRALATALRNGARAELRNARGVRSASASLAGLSAAMLHIDETQRRLGTTTALIRTGPRIASAPPPALPVIAGPPVTRRPPRTITVARATQLIGDGNARCDYAISKVEPLAYRLDARTSLVMVAHPCGNGAYNLFSSAFTIAENGRIAPARFENDGPPQEGDMGLVNSEWDARTRRLTSYAKGRGLGDCGVTQNYAWDGTRFRLVEQAEMGECRGSTDYITTWRASVVQK